MAKTSTRELHHQKPLRDLINPAFNKVQTKQIVAGVVRETGSDRMKSQRMKSQIMRIVTEPKHAGLSGLG